MTGRIIDVSSAQHPDNDPIAWPAVAEDGVTTALIKATQDTTYTNPFFEQDVAGALEAGLDVLAYHYAGFTDAAAEAEFFISVAGELAAIGDFETSENVPWMRTFLQALGRPADTCMGYGSASTFRSVYQQIPALPWVAAYGQGYPGWGVLWQFTDSASVAGIPALVDENSWHGSEIQYETLFNKTSNGPGPGHVPYGGGLMFDGLAASKQDNFNATLRYLWGQIRTDGMEPNTQSTFWYYYNLPAAQKGAGGSIDEVVAQIIDQAEEKGTLRPGWAGAV